MKGRFEMVSEGYGIIKFMTVRRSDVYGSRDNTEYVDFLCIFLPFRILTYS